MTPHPSEYAPTDKHTRTYAHMYTYSLCSQSLQHTKMRQNITHRNICTHTRTHIFGLLFIHVLTHKHVQRCGGKTRDIHSCNGCPLLRDDRYCPRHTTHCWKYGLHVTTYSLHFTFTSHSPHIHLIFTHSLHIHFILPMHSPHIRLNIYLTYSPTFTPYFSPTPL